MQPQRTQPEAQQKASLRSARLAQPAANDPSYNTQKSAKILPLRQKASARDNIRKTAKQTRAYLRTQRRASYKQDKKADAKPVVRPLSDMPYYIAIALGVLKDLLDVAFVSLGLITGGAGLIVATVITFCMSIAILLLLTIGHTTSRSRMTGRSAQFLILGVVTLVEGLGFYLNVLPLYSLGMFAIYIIGVVIPRATRKMAGLKPKKKGLVRRTIGRFGGSAGTPA